MPDPTDQDTQRRLSAVEREMQRRRDAEDEREGRDLIDTVEDQQQRDRDRNGDD